MGEWVTTKEPTCTEKGEQTRTCVREGCDKTETRSVNALGHTWGAWVTDEEAKTKTRICTVCGASETRPLRSAYVMNVCSMGIRFRDLPNPITDEWFMFTPIDLSVEGEQTIKLVAGNVHVIGTVTVTVQDGMVTVSNTVNNMRDIVLKEEFLTFVPSLDDLTELDFDAMTNYPYDEPISIEEALGGNTKVLLIMRNRAWYDEGVYGADSFSKKEYEAYVEQLKLMMTPSEEN